MKYLLALVSVAALASFGCSKGRLTADGAADHIAGLDQFKREAHFTLRIGVPFQTAFKCHTEAELARVPVNQFVMQRGWVRYESREALFGFGTKASCPAMVLTPSGEMASAVWSQGKDGAGSREGVVWAVPIGRRELIAVTDLTTATDESMQAEFTWKWAPNETGTALRQAIPAAKELFDVARSGRASCRRLNNDWRCQLAMWTTPADAGEFRP